MGWIRTGLSLCQDTEHEQAGKVLELGLWDQRAAEMALLWEQESAGHPHSTEGAS